MEFKTLKDRMLYYRSLTDYKVMPNCYTLVMLDGRSFSKMVKNKFELPFDDNFIDMMNETAKYICKKIQGALFAYVQSDEISILLSDKGDTFFGGRLNKMQSIIASMAASKFNQLMMLYNLKNGIEPNDPMKIVENAKLVDFDCKVWNVPTFNDAIAWFIYRQIDCIRNSKQQAAQTYLSFEQLLNQDTDKQITLLKVNKGIEWETEYDDGKKYGRFIYKEITPMRVYVEKLDKEIKCNRSFWSTHFAFELTDNGKKDEFIKLIKSLKELRVKEN